MSYLIFASLDAAMARSEAAYAPLRQVATTTTHLWAARAHPVDGRAALEIPTTPTAAGIEMSQVAYDGLLGADEREALTSTLPEDWTLSGLEM